MIKKGIFSVDVESNGLYGNPFIVSAVVIDYDDPRIVQNSFTGRCPIQGKIDNFVIDTVLPACADIKQNYDNFRIMLKRFAEYYKIYKDNYDVVAHIPYPVEFNLFSLMVKFGYLKETEAPFPIYCPSALLLKAGYDPTSVDNYYMENIVGENEFIKSHNPYYDAIIAGRVWIDLINK